MKSSIFLNAVTVIDHAYINHDGLIVGGSFLASFLVTGETDPLEKVVVDFSTLKKDIKRLIDRHDYNNSNNGFDHKLWLLNNYSDFNVVKIGETDLQITTLTAKLTLPRDAVKLFDGRYSSTSTIEKSISSYLTSNLKLEYPDININVKCLLHEGPILVHDTNPKFTQIFRYTHGLKNSTSYGCRNIAHGHRSFLSIPGQSPYDICLELDNAVFISKENIIKETAESINVSYTSGDRFFEAEYLRKKNNLIILETETTIEFLAEYVKDKYNITKPFYISEGLTKGAYKE